MFCSCNDPELLNEYKARLSEDGHSMQEYVAIPFLRGSIEKLVDRYQIKPKVEAESKDRQTSET